MSSIPASCHGVPYVDVLPQQPSEEIQDGNGDDLNASSSSSSRCHLRFWSDRFYVNATHAEEKEWEKTSLASAATPSGNDLSGSASMFSAAAPQVGCTCGQAAPPPLFPRERFVRSLDIKAAILGTYVWSPSWFATTFPDLVDSIPTLLLHGHKGMTRDYFDRKGAEENGDEDTDVDVYDSDDEEVDNNNDGEGEMTSEHRRSQPPPKEIMERFRNQRSTFQMNYVSCHWKKRIRDSSQFVSDESTANGNSRQRRHVRETRMGVHHPKFMLLLETTGSLVVLISTANLIPTKTVEGTWVQRFHPVRKRHQENTTTPRNNNNHRNDFGMVLQDFLIKLSDAAECPTAVNDFMEKHFDCSLQELHSKFHFHAAQAYLVPVVPGDYPGPASNPKSDKPQQFYYGHQRVRYILNKMAKDTPRNSKKTHDPSKSDRLVLQPTSWGADWTKANFAALVRGYMGYPELDLERNDDWVCGQADIVWPSDKMIANLSGGKTLEEAISATTALVTSQEPLYPGGDGGSFVFNSSDTFNRCELPIVARLCQYTASAPEQVQPKVPHFKSVARVIPNHGAEIFRKVKVGQADTYLSWFLLTSACLSHGAQGVPVDTENNAESYYGTTTENLVGYRNFELGILFTSNVMDPRFKAKQGMDDYRKRKKQRLYCFHPHQCSCQPKSSISSNTLVSLVHLPVPYTLRPESYFHGHEEDEEELPTTMKETPFFHSVLPASRCVGNMLMTPFGQRLFEMIRDSDSPTKRLKLG
jgi:Tyrosyl-DNA phosphodiesterase